MGVSDKLLFGLQSVFAHCRFVVLTVFYVDYHGGASWPYEKRVALAAKM